MTALPALTQRSASSIGKAVAHAAANAFDAAGVAGAAIVMTPIVLFIGALTLPIAIAAQANKALEIGLSRVMFNRVDKIEQAADAAGLSRDKVVVGHAQKYIRQDMDWGPSSFFARESSTLARLDQWREEHAGRRRGLWISKADERAAMAQIDSQSANRDQPSPIAPKPR